jgi:hypothetical protein
MALRNGKVDAIFVTTFCNPGRLASGMKCCWASADIMAGYAGKRSGSHAAFVGWQPEVVKGKETNEERALN